MSMGQKAGGIAPHWPARTWHTLGLIKALVQQQRFAALQARDFAPDVGQFGCYLMSGHFVLRSGGHLIFPAFG